MSEFRLDTDKFVRVLSKLEPSFLVDDDGDEVAPEPWTDHVVFENWLREQTMPDPFRAFLLNHTPSVTLESNHGPIFGIDDLMEENTIPGIDGYAEAIREAGFVCIGRGPNGDFVVVFTEGHGETGWLPLAGSFEFVGTAPSIGQFLEDSEEKWDTVAKDWHQANRIKNSGR